MRFASVHIVGVGLIGGSFALAIREAGLADRIIGWDVQDTLEKALHGGIIDTAGDLESTREFNDASLLYLAAPVGSIVEFLRSDAGSIKSGAIVTDAGSTKREICNMARKGLARGVAFVPGHPMTGSHNSGIEFCRADLFKGAPYALIAEQEQSELDQGARRTMEEVVRRIGAVPVVMTAEEHDRAVAFSSHAPQLLSTALAIAVGKQIGPAKQLFGGGLSDMTRLAMSDWSVWKDICVTNADEISSALDEVIKQVQALSVSVRERDVTQLREHFEAAHRFATDFQRSE